MNQHCFRHIVVMGVSGSGKTTVGEALSPLVGLEYRDGDDMHPQANIDKMAAGTPLNDADREPWLKQIGQWLADRPEGAMVGCSALKRKYRDLIREYCPGVVFVHVHGDFDVLHERMQHRPGALYASIALAVAVRYLGTAGRRRNWPRL